MHGKYLIKEAEARGWTVLRKTGSHCIMGHPERPDRVVVPYKVMCPGLASHLRSRLKNGMTQMGGRQNRGK